MKNIVKILIISFLSFPAMAQLMSGQIIFERREDWVKKMNKAKYLTQEEKDREEQTWKNDEIFVHKLVLTFTPNQTFYTHENQTQTSQDGTYSWRADDYIVTRDFDKNTLFEYKEMLVKNYIIKDSLQAPKWKILNEIKEVAGYICMKASTFDAIKDQEVVAWFSTDIPVSGGPEEYYGLPGMILELNIDNEAVLVTATSVVLNKDQKLPELPKKMKGKTINLKTQSELITKYRKEQEALHRFPWGIRY
ncbi:MAG: GLPGLI family protein [Cytophagaceae bacterium]|nr:GLPGLI family protein [Cytophagaceae bacterium]